MESNRIKRKVKFNNLIKEFLNEVKEESIENQIQRKVPADLEVYLKADVGQI